MRTLVWRITWTSTRWVAYGVWVLFLHFVGFLMWACLMSYLIGKFLVHLAWHPLKWFGLGLWWLSGVIWGAVCAVCQFTFHTRAGHICLFVTLWLLLLIALVYVA